MSAPSKLRFGIDLSELQVNNIQFLIDNKIDESQNLEYKQPSADLKEDCNRIGETSSGFLNTDGGILIYGVSEVKENGHRFSDKLVWSKAIKETIESIIISKIHPWHEGIKIQRISNEKNKSEAIFVIEIPKSNNPPHMCNYRYYQRLNYQTMPMSHESVFRVFQTSWIRRQEISKTIIEPLYSEIKSNSENVEKCRWINNSKHMIIMADNRFLYDQLEPTIKAKIDGLYEKSEHFNFLLGLINKITTKIINEEISKIFPALKDLITQHLEEDNFSINVSAKDVSGKETNSTISSAFRDALLQKRSLMKYLQEWFPSQLIVRIEPIIRNSNYTVSQSEFRRFWEACKDRAKKDSSYLMMWKERLEFLKDSKNICEEMLAK